MKTLFVNIEKETVTVNNQTCNFIEAGLMPNGEKVTDPDEIIEHLEDRNEGEEIEIIFEDEKRYIIAENIEEFLSAMNFDKEDTHEVIRCKELDKSHTLLLFVNSNKHGYTISITPSDADIYFYIIHNTIDSDIISETLTDIQKFIDNNSLIEL